MIRIGFSTGAVALGDFRLGLERLKPFHLDAIELSALRAPELDPLIGAFDTLDLTGYSYVSLHGPSGFGADQEMKIVELIKDRAHHFDAVVVHPDSLHHPSVWAEMGDLLCIENMDKRKRIGRTAEELAELFDRFPNARLCFDLGHVWQVDRTMVEARQILRRFRDRISHLHVSEVNTQSEHMPLSVATVTAFRRVLDLLPEVPWIMEAVVPPDRIESEIRYARESFAEAIHLIPD